MTRDEAITVLLNVAWLGTDEERERIEEAVSMAIEALKQGDVLQEIRNEIENLTIARVDDDYVRKMAGLFIVKREIIAIIDKHIGDTE